MIKYYLENPEWSLERATDGSSGYDLRATCGVPREIYPGQRFQFATGLFLQMPLGVEAQVRSRSGLALHHGVAVLNSPGTIDGDYRGEVKVILYNSTRPTPRSMGQNSNDPDPAIYTVREGDKIAQLVFAPVLVPGVYDPEQPYLAWRECTPVRVAQLIELSTTQRGASGHGSTGR